MLEVDLDWSIFAFEDHNYNICEQTFFKFDQEYWRIQLIFQIIFHFQFIQFKGK